MKLSKGYVIDAAKAGSIARYINHSCKPNSTTEKWIVGKEERIGIFALRGIAVDVMT